MQPEHACRYVDSGTVLNNYAHIFDLLIRLRQAVNHPYLVVYSASGNKSAPGSALGAGGDGANTSSPGAAAAVLPPAHCCSKALRRCYLLRLVSGTIVVQDNKYYGSCASFVQHAGPVASYIH